ncbi:MAG: hypothetical protein V1813_00210 [Candidatus Aenigmatarchaeota archaeon]
MHIMRRGQAEFALILGIVIIAAFVAVFAFSVARPPSVDQSFLTNEQKAVETYVLDALEKSSKRTLTAIYKQGGYIDPANEGNAVRFVEFGGDMVPYWQVCQNTYIPTDAKITADIEKGAGEMLWSMLPEKTDIAGKIVEFQRDSIEVEAIVHTDKVSFTAKVPSAIDGQPMDIPYKVDVDSRLGRIIDFAADFSNFQKKYRALDGNLMKLVGRSNPYIDCWLPIRSVSSDEGVYTLTWENARTCMQEHISYTLAHTRMWEGPPLEDDYPTESGLKYAYIPQIENAAGQWLRYDDLKIDFSYSGADTPLKRTSNEFMLDSDPDSIIVEPTQIVMFTLPGYYDITYDVSFPAAVLVTDDFMGIPFRFMTFVNIRGNSARKSDNVEEGLDCSIGDFDEEVQSDYVLRCETGLSKDVDITVTRKGSGQKLPGVYVFFDELCLPWTTDGQGKISGTKAPQMSNPKIDFYDVSSSSSYSVCIANSDNLNGMPVYMPIRGDFTMRLYKVEIAKSGGRYTITGIKPVSVISSTGEKVDVEMARQQSGGCPPPEEGSLYAFKNYYYKNAGGGNIIVVLNSRGVIDEASYEESTAGLPDNNVRFEVEDTYDVKVAVQDYGSVTRSGMVLQYGVYGQGAGKNIIYVYAPKIVFGVYTDTDEVKLAELYKKCKLPPLSESNLLAYDQAYNPSNSLSKGVIGCWYQ